MEQHNQLPTPKISYSKMTIDELNNLSEEHQRALMLETALNTAKDIKRIKNNVLFFFWIIFLSGVIFILVTLIQNSSFH